MWLWIHAWERGTGRERQNHSVHKRSQWKLEQNQSELPRVLMFYYDQNNVKVNQGQAAAAKIHHQSGYRDQKLTLQNTASQCRRQGPAWDETKKCSLKDITTFTVYSNHKEKKDI